MPRSAATSRAISITPARRTAIRGSSATPSGSLPPGTSSAAPSSPTTIRLTESARFSACAGLAARPGSDAAASMLVVYLHGFASSAGSSKATYLAERLRACGVDFQAPDLNLPDFTTLTVTRMLEQTGVLIDRVSGPITLVG